MCAGAFIRHLFKDSHLFSDFHETRIQRLPLVKCSDAYMRLVFKGLTLDCRSVPQPDTLLKTFLKRCVQNIRQTRFRGPLWSRVHGLHGTFSLSTARKKKFKGGLLYTCLETHSHMNVEIEAVAVLFLFWEYLFPIFGIGSLQCVLTVHYSH